MSHPLDRPIWSALTGPQAALAQGGPQAWRIDPAVGWFAAAADPGDPGALSPLLTDGAPLVMFEDAAVASCAGLDVTSDVMVQMVADRLGHPAPGASIVALGDADAGAMLTLATLTRPSPYLAQTHRFGGFQGIREHGALVAMAGTRLRVPGFVEISGVCTHPDHRGHGYAARLMQAVAAAIVAGGARPFLHAYAANTGAIALYDRLGFRRRRALTASFLARAIANDPPAG